MPSVGRGRIALVWLEPGGRIVSEPASLKLTAQFCSVTVAAFIVNAGFRAAENPSSSLGGSGVEA
jgi:hypothetical protein